MIYNLILIIYTIIIKKSVPLLPFNCWELWILRQFMASFEKSLATTKIPVCVFFSNDQVMPVNFNAGEKR